MYANSMVIGRGERGAYRRKDKPMKAVKRAKVTQGEIVAYIETRTGEYDEFEKLYMDDPYVEGWEWREKGKKRHRMKISPFLSKPRKAERLRLLNLGFDDCDAWMERMNLV